MGTFNSATSGHTPRSPEYAAMHVSTVRCPELLVGATWELPAGADKLRNSQSRYFGATSKRLDLGEATLRGLYSAASHLLS